MDARRAEEAMIKERTTTVAPVWPGWRNPASTSGQIYAAVHRGAFFKDGRVVEAENSVPAIRRADALGCDMVEVDVHFTRDGHAVVIHDPTLDRTTEAKGIVVEHDLADLTSLPLVHPESREPFDATLPALEEIFEALGDRMMINVECKTGISAIPKVASIAAASGVLDQVTVKTACSRRDELVAVAKVLEDCDKQVDYIPVVEDTMADLVFLRELYGRLSPSCIECLVGFPKDRSGYPGYYQRGLTMDGGPLFSRAARRLAQQHNTRLFLNTLYYDPRIDATQWNGGRHDELARIAPDSVFGFWIAHGATVLQTDEPEYLLSWLCQAGFREGSSGNASA